MTSENSYSSLLRTRLPEVRTGTPGAGLVVRQSNTPSRLRCDSLQYLLRSTCPNGAALLAVWTLRPCELAAANAISLPHGMFCWGNLHAFNVGWLFIPLIIVDQGAHDHGNNVSHRCTHVSCYTGVPLSSVIMFDRLKATPEVFVGGVRLSTV